MLATMIPSDSHSDKEIAIALDENIYSHSAYNNF